MTEKLDQEHADLLIYKIVSDTLDRMYERLDELHKRNIDDTEVITALRKGGYRDIAEGYIDWSGAVDPDYAEEDNTTMNPVVPDPGDAPSYNALDAALGTERKDPDSWPATPGELSAELTAAGINADNLEQAIVQAVMEEATKAGIEHGTFYAEPSVTGGWNVYKKRGKYDNGVFIGHFADENAAIHVLEALDSGTL